ncbi:MAG TPA: zinc-binding dehydrogenase, partial [Bacteroidales bacterium]|nr:zinc-binding dehydrogenase [Bacteroidales bacterium]
KHGITLQYVNTAEHDDAAAYLRSLTDGKGYDDAFVFAPVKPVVEQADAILGFDGCMNFFAGPANPEFKAELNFYNVHYAFTHITGTSGGNTADMKESLLMMAEGSINPAGMITHIGGLDAVIETTKNLPHIPGGKKLIYTNISLPLTAIDDFEEKGKNDPFFAELDELVKANGGLWNVEAEKYVLKNGKPI